jgi:glycine cleavage system H protein
MNIPSNLGYTAEHEWVRREGDLAVVGITDYAQHSLGDVVFVELPEEGTSLRAGQAFGVVESVKAVSDLFTPVSGTVVKVNAELLDRPELLNTDAYGNWMIVVQIQNEADFDALLDEKAYAALLEQEN